MHPDAIRRNGVNSLTSQAELTERVSAPIDPKKLPEYLSAAGELWCTTGLKDLSGLQRTAMMRWRFPELSLAAAKRIIDTVSLLAS